MRASRKALGFVYVNGGDAGQVSVVVSGGGYSGMDPFQVRFCLSILFFPFPFGNAFSLLELRVYCSCFLSRGFLGPGFRLVKEDWIGWVPVDLLPLSPSVSMCLGPCLRCVIEGEEI